MEWRRGLRDGARRFSAWVRSRPGHGRIVAVSALVGTAAIATAVQYFLPGIYDDIRGKGDDPPLAVTVDVAPPVGSAGTSNVFFVPGGSEALPPPPADCQAWHEWARDHEGGDVDATTVRVTLQSSTDLNVIIVGSVSVEEVDRNDTVSVVRCEPGGDFAVPRHVEIDLDDGSQPWRYVVFDREQEIPIGLSIAPGESEIVDFVASAGSGTYEWRLELDMLVDGETQRLSLDDDGEPFRTTKRPPGAASLTFRDGEWQQP